MLKRSRHIMLLLLLLISFTEVLAVQRFPKPDFETGYIQPETVQPSARSDLMGLVDVVVLAASLALVSLLVLKKRSRTGVFWTSVFSLAYFGFYRTGCVCSIGAIQNVALALFDHSYLVPLTVIIFFVLPLVFSLFFGRTFCAGVCPFGAIQDLVSFRPQRLNERLNAILGVIPYIYLGLAILFAATGSDFIICRYDPFVGIFRFNASFGMLVFAVMLLVSGIFIARPYCRFLCPYGVLLNWVSRFSWRHITITPKECVNCRLCEDSCPYDAIDVPVPGRSAGEKHTTTRKLILISLMVPFFIFLGGWTGSRLHETLAGVHHKVRLAKMIIDTGKEGNQPEPMEITAFKTAGVQPETVFREASQVLRRFYIGGWILGGFIGLVFGAILAGRLIPRYRAEYVPNKGRCYSCARCVDYCPVGRDNKIH